MKKIDQLDFIQDPLGFLREAADEGPIKIILDKEIGPFEFEGDIVITPEGEIEKGENCCLNIEEN